MRIVTRPDFDGIVCAVLLFEALKNEPDLQPEIHWTEPGEIQSGEADIRQGDILANLPFHKDCLLWFDHHVSNRPDGDFPGAFAIAPSAARVILDYYQAKGKLSHRFDELVIKTDMIDAADLTIAQVRYPEKDPWVILSMTIYNDGYKDIPYWNHLVALLGQTPDTSMMKDAEITRRCEAAYQENQAFEKYLIEHTQIVGQVSVTDFRGLNPVPSGNRFLTYSLFPETTTSIKIRYKDEDSSKVLISVGRSIFTKGSHVNIGKMLAKYGGGGHAGAGGCTMNAGEAQHNIDEILHILTENAMEDDSKPVS